MNILTDMLIKGDIFLEYAFLGFEFLFKNELETAASAEYRFALPKGAVISNVKIVERSGKIIRTSVISRSHAERMYEAGGSAVLRRLDDNIYSLRIDMEPSDRVKIIASVYAPLASNDDGCQLIIPLAAGIGGAKSKLQAEIELNIRGAESITSVTHSLDLIDAFGGVYVKTGKIAADRDFCLNIKSDRKNTAVVSRDGVKFQMLCKVYPDGDFCDTKKDRYKKLMLIYDGETLCRGAAAAARELMCALFDKFCGEYMAVISNNGFYSVTDGFCRLDHESELTVRLSDASAEGALLTGEELRAYIDAETLPIFICGGELSRNPFGEEFYGSGMSVVTLGGVSFCKEAEQIVSVCGGRRKHIFGGDDINECAERIISEFSENGLQNIDAAVSGADAFAVDNTSGVLVYAEGFGDPPTNEVELIHKDRRKRISLDSVEVYKGFAPIGLVYAEHICSRLRERLAVCPPEQVCEIHRQMEDIGVRFSALNCETAMAAAYAESAPRAVRVIIEDGACRSFEAFEGRSSAFREREKELSRAELCKRADLYADLIARNMRGSGAICALGEIDPNSVRYQTLVCCLALISAGFADKYRDIINKGAEYLKRCGGEKLTYDMEGAREKLCTLLGENTAIEDGIPDILTASKLLWQNAGEKEAYFW